MLAKRARLAPGVRSGLPAVFCSKPWPASQSFREVRRSSIPVVLRRTCCTQYAATDHRLSGSVEYAPPRMHGMAPQSFAFRTAGNYIRPIAPCESVAGVGGVRDFAAGRGTTKRKKSAKGEVPEVPAFIGVRELADLFRHNSKKLFKLMGGHLSKRKWRVVLSGVPYAFDSLGHVIVPFEDACKVARKLGTTIRFLDVDMRPERATLGVPTETEGKAWREEGEGARRPVVVLLGHFNHGKTTILDALLGPQSGIAEQEAGGITQEIRARTISLRPSPNAKDPPSESTASVPVATFLDTPGQEIFYRMRTNGARVADAVVLVISAVDGICLQTSESIGCAEQLGLPAVVAINKVDLLPEDERSQRLESLSQEVREFVATSDATVIPISAKTGYGLDDLRAAIASALAEGIPFDPLAEPTDLATSGSASLPKIAGHGTGGGSKAIVESRADELATTNSQIAKSDITETKSAKAKGAQSRRRSPDGEGLVPYAGHDEEDTQTYKSLPTVVFADGFTTIGHTPDKPVPVDTRRFDPALAGPDPFKALMKGKSVDPELLESPDIPEGFFDSPEDLPAEFFDSPKDLPADFFTSLPPGGSEDLPIESLRDVAVKSLEDVQVKSLEDLPAESLEDIPVESLESSSVEYFESIPSGYSGSSTIEDSESPPARCSDSNALAVTSKSDDSGAADGYAVTEAEAPKSAATATVLDYVSSAKSGKVMLLLVDVGVLRPGDWFVSGMMWGVVRSIYEEEGVSLVEHAGPGLAVKVVVTPKEKVDDAPLGEPFRVLTRDAAFQVALVRKLASTIDESIDHRRMRQEFAPVLNAATAALSSETAENDGSSESEAEEEDEAEGVQEYEAEDVDEAGHVKTFPSNDVALRASTIRALREKAAEAEEDKLAQEDMPVTVVVKADSANTLMSVLDAIGDWGEYQEQGVKRESQATGIDLSKVEEKERGWRPNQRLVVNIARSGVGAVTSSDVKLAEDCETPVFAHNVRPDSQARKLMRKKGSSLITAAPEGQEDPDRKLGWKGGQVVVSETVGELLGEIERFVVSVR